VMTAGKQSMITVWTKATKLEISDTSRQARVTEDKMIAIKARPTLAPWKTLESVLKKFRDPQCHCVSGRPRARQNFIVFQFHEPRFDKQIG
jgi:hypothetical protein